MTISNETGLGVKGNGRSGYAMRLAERGLAVQTFDGHTLKMSYSPEADSQLQQGQPVSGDELTAYARSVLADIPETSQMFPGLERIEIDFGQI